MTGVPLPLISAGGTSLVVTLFVVGLLARFARPEPAAVAASWPAARAAAPSAAAAGRRGVPPEPAAAAGSTDRVTGRGRSPRRTGGRGDAASAPTVAADQRRVRGGPPPMTCRVSVVLAGGGTGGHIEPMLALADALRRLRPDARRSPPGHRARHGDHGWCPPAATSCG